MVDKLGDDEVWDLLGRIRDALHEFLPENALVGEAQTPDDEVDEIIKGIRMLGQGIADKL